MATIAVLDQNTIDKIAAGEVVERPASVVKELVENAMDAGATAITVEIRDGGISLVRITDNGSGIPAEQVPLAFLRHATSKIRSVEELVQIASLGFRGEALSSISAVAQIEMITKTPDALTGTRYVIEGGAEKANEEVGAPTGTTFLVRNLFYNTPARQKFLKTPVTEANAVTSVVEQLALSHPGISFKYMVNSQVKLHTSGNRNLKELVYNIYGRDIARELIEIHSESPLMTIDGFIGKPVISRGEEVGAPTGTTFLVRNLFYNTPARQKFLKTPVTEANAVTSVVEQLALSHPGISFKYMVNSQVKLHTSGNRNLKELVYNIYGRDIARELIEIHSESPLMTIDGFIGKPVISRGNRNFENYYVNGRYVRSKLLARAIEDGYQTSMMQHKYPFTLFYVQMDGEAVDVNVHPTKMELRFSHQEEIYRQMRDMISGALNHREQIVNVSLSSDRERKAEEKAARKEQIVVPEPFEQKRQVKEGFARQSLPVEPVSSQSRRMPIFPEVERNGYRAAKTYVPVQQMTGMTREEEELFEPGAGNVPKTADHSVQTEKTAVLSSAETAAEMPMQKETALPQTSQTFLKQTETPNRMAESQQAAARNKDVKAWDQQESSNAEQEVTNPAGSSSVEAIQHPQEPETVPQTPSMPEERSSASASSEPEGQMQLFDEQFLTPEAEKSHRIIGQVFDTYWLIQYGENLYIIDQHAAHEKVLFERMMKNYREKNVTSQMVSPPLIVSLTPQEADLVTRYMDVFQSFGYEISPFGGKDYAINAVPHNLYGIATEELFIEILDNLEEVREKPLEILKDRLATMSCKAAVKGNNHLSYAEAEQLIAELLTLEDPYHCPHGRPTIISLSKRELEKKFKRIV